MSTSPTPLPSPSQFLTNLWNDILGFFASLTGRVTVGGPMVATMARPTISARQAIQQAIATEHNLNPRDFVSGWYVASNPAWQAEVQRAYIDFGEAGQCGQTPTPGLSFGQASGMAIGAAGAGVGIAASTGVIAASTATLASTVVLAPVAVIVGIVAVIFAHHAAAVARDMRSICALLPASNNAFQSTIAAVSSGELSPGNGIQVMDAIPAQFLIQAGASKNNSPYCNALCEYLIRVRAISYYWKSQFEGM